MPRQAAPGNYPPGDLKNFLIARGAREGVGRGSEVWSTYVSKEDQVRAQLCIVTGHDSRPRVTYPVRSALAGISFSRSRLHRSRLFDLVQVFLCQLSIVGTACNIMLKLPLGERSHYMRT